MPDRDRTRSLAEQARSFATQDQMDWDEICDSASEIVIFGSRAAGVQSRSSDLDVLCIGEGRRHRSPHIDLLWKPEQYRDSTAWLTSELAGHIAQYGIWIAGSDDWRNLVRTGTDAERKKERRIVNLADALDAHWSHLDPEFRVKYLVTIRRDLQRLMALREGQAVPPTPLLDHAWIEDDAMARRWLEAMKLIRSGDLSSANRLLRVADLVTTARETAHAGPGVASVDSASSLRPLVNTSSLQAPPDPAHQRP